jgi:hypothetical protein
MMKFINPKTHGILDFLYIAVLALAPGVLNFEDIAATLCYILAAAVLGLVLLTRYPFGLLKVIPFTVHGMLELVSSLVVIAAPWIFGFETVLAARNFYMAAGILLLAVWLFTDYKAAEVTTPSRAS